MHISWGKDGVAWSWSSSKRAVVTWLDWASRVRWHMGLKWIESTFYFNKNMLILSLSWRPCIQLLRLRQAVQSCPISPRVFCLANVACLCLVFQLYLFIYLSLTCSSPCFVHLKVKITQSQLFPLSVDSKNHKTTWGWVVHGIRAHLKPLFLHLLYPFYPSSPFPFTFCISGLSLSHPSLMSSSVLSRPVPSFFFVPFPAFLFNVYFIWMFLIGPAGLRTMLSQHQRDQW